MEIKIEHKENHIISFLAGVVSGCTKLVVGHPFDTIKVRLQTEGTNGRFKGPIDCLKSTVLKEGPLAVYKGASPPLIGWALTDSVMVGTYTNCKDFLLQEYPGIEGSGKYAIHSVAGLSNLNRLIFQYSLLHLVAGSMSALISTPVEQIKAKLQVQYDAKTKVYSGPIDCAKHLIKSRGLRLGLWSGFCASILLRSHFALYWPSYQYISDSLKNISQPYRDNVKPFIPFLSGGVTSLIFWSVAFPSDVIKNRIMGQAITTPLKYPSVRQCFKYVLKTEGWRGFYRGFTPALMRSVPTNGAALFMYELVMKYK